MNANNTVVLPISLEEALRRVTLEEAARRAAQGKIGSFRAPSVTSPTSETAFTTAAVAAEPGTAPYLIGSVIEDAKGGLTLRITSGPRQSPSPGTPTALSPLALTPFLTKLAATQDGSDIVPLPHGTHR